jgi:biotin carboxyl carrier protein
MSEVFKVKIDAKEFSVKMDNRNSGMLNDKPFSLDVTSSEHSMHVLKDNKSYSIDILEINKEEKFVSMLVNGHKYKVDVKDKYDQLLSSLGLDKLLSKKVNDIKAPMPGLVVDVRVQAGDVVKKGDPVLVLEAMKMENILKAPGDGKVAKVHVTKGVAVEKNQVLVNLE